MSTPAPPILQKPKHIKYWLRCLRTCLPTDYTSTDLNRLTLGFFCIAALDLLGCLHTETTEEDRTGWINWIYKNQLPIGGFRGSPATDLGKADGSEWDPPIVPASFFALAALVSLGDNLERVKKRELLELLPKVQREDGSFGEWLGGDGQIIGGSDMRFVYCAVAIRWILRGREGKGVVEGVKDIDVEGVVKFIRSAESYEHGISDKAFGEAHGFFPPSFFLSLYWRMGLELMDACSGIDLLCYRSSGPAGSTTPHLRRTLYAREHPQMAYLTSSTFTSTGRIKRRGIREPDNQWY